MFSIIPAFIPVYAALVSWTQGLLPFTDGCGTHSSWNFDATNHSNVTLPGSHRSFYVHIPRAYNPNIPHPVVLSFHGYRGDDAHQEHTTGLSKDGLKIGTREIISVYPLGEYGPGKVGEEQSRSWQGAPYAKPGIDDIAYVKEIIAELTANLCIDSKRIYASGMSNGGGFTNLLACTPSTASLIAAFAPVSPALYSGTHPLKGCEPGRVVPLLTIHGLEDRIVPFHGRTADRHGNKLYALPAIPAFREAWARRNGCAHNQKPTISHPHNLTTVHTWQCSPNDPRSIVKGYSVQGLGHHWPSTEGPEDQRAPFNATTEDILPFFSAHRLDDRSLEDL